ncbi:MAG TPA: APC family permease [Vicinamibacterales bacterium]|nr:APC family permease [Vicinamibacterales bacterium]
MSTPTKVQSPEPKAKDALLSRELGVRQLAAVIFNYTVGSGIFVLPAVVAAQLGPSAIVAYLVCAFIMALSVICFAEAGSRVSASGGPYGYVETAFGSLAGFLTGVLNLLSAIAAAAAVASAFAASAAALIGTSSPIVRVFVMAAVLIAAAVINVRSVGGGARLVEVAVAAKLVPLALFVVVGAAFVRPEYLSWSSTPSLITIMSTSGVLIFAFMGIEGALQPSGEVRDPSRTVPRAVFLAIAGVVVLYIAIQVVAQGLLGADLPSDRVAPLAQAAAMVAGPAGRTLMLVGATVSMFGFLCGTVLTGPRSLFAFAQAGLAPRALAAVHASRRTPHVAIVVYIAISFGLALSGSFESLLVLTNVSGLLVYIGVAVAAWELRRRDVRAHGAPFVAPGGALIPALTCVIIVGVIVATVTRLEVIAVGAVLAVSVVVYLFRR